MASVRFRLNHPRSPENPVTILVRFYSKKTGRLDISTGEICPPEHWEGQRVSSKYKNYSRINKHLSKIEGELLDLWRDHRSTATAEELKSLVRGIVKGETTTDQKKTVAHIVQQFIAQYEKEKDPATVKRYKGLLKKLTLFNAQLTIDQLDQNFYDEFKTFLYSCPNGVYGDYRINYEPHTGSHTLVQRELGDTIGSNVGLFDDTVFKYIVNLKTICAWAEKRNHQVHPSYKTWEIIKRDYQPISLTLDELKAIENLVLPPHLDVARDYLSLECRTGQRISDLRRFSKSDINGNIWTFTQKKGNRLNANRITLPLVGYCAPALLILQKYNYELPKISEQKLNEHIKTVCKRAGIVQAISIYRWAGSRKIAIPGAKYEFISTHTGRKTFITIALQFMQPHTVMQITGIRSFKTLRHYAGEVEMMTIEAGLRSIEDNIAIMKKHG